eukprot:Sdes_comp19415_c0_seq1m10757
MILNAENLAKLRPAKVYKDFNDRLITSLDFTNNGDHCIVSCEDESIRIYSCFSGSPYKTLYSKKYGVDCIRYTHGMNTVIHASTKGDHNIRYLSLHDNRYLRYFSGHVDKVTNLSMSPVDDTFFSSSLDGSVRLWDLRSPACKGKLQSGGSPVIAIEWPGRIFCVGTDSQTLRLYDTAGYEKGPFSVFPPPAQLKGPKASLYEYTECAKKRIQWTSIKFSHSGNHILLATDSTLVYLIDAFEGHIIAQFTDIPNEKRLPLQADITPDDNFVMIGSGDGHVRVFDITGNLICQLAGHTDPIRCLAFNPKYYFVASASHELGFWLTNCKETPTTQ